MKTRLALVMTALWCAVLPVPAGARVSSGEDPQLAHQILNDFAKCSVKYEHDLAVKVTLGSLGGMSVTELERVLDPRCFGLWRVHFRASDLAMRAAFAEALVQRDFKRWPVLNPSGVGPLNWPVPKTIRPGPGVKSIDPTYAQTLLSSLAADARVGRLGECVVRASPEGAIAVLDTKIDTRAEMAALKALTPQIAMCMKAGEATAFNRTNLRYAIALSYYRLAYPAGSTGRLEAAE